MKSNYHLIKNCSISDGIGVRVSIFLSGCQWHCTNCHNRMTWSPDSGQPITDDTIEELCKYLDNDYITGITLTGGDPLYESNLETSEAIIDMVRDKYPKKDIWLYTGFELKNLQSDNDAERLRIIDKVDVLVDGPYVDELRDITYKYAGSTNQRVIDVKHGYIDFDPERYYLRQ